MVVNQTNFTIFTTDRFERRVILYGNQATSILHQERE